MNNISGEKKQGFASQRIIVNSQRKRQVIEAWKNHPEASFRTIARLTGCSKTSVYNYLSGKAATHKPKGKPSRKVQWISHGHPLPPDGFVYFIADAEDRFIKIGFSGNPQNRLEQLQSSHPIKLRIVHQGFGDVALEKSIHAIFRHWAHSGEWFTYSAEIKEYVEWLQSESFTRMLPINDCLGRLTLEWFIGRYRPGWNSERSGRSASDGNPKYGSVE